MIILLAAVIVVIIKFARAVSRRRSEYEHVREGSHATHSTVCFSNTALTINDKHLRHGGSGYETSYSCGVYLNVGYDRYVLRHYSHSSHHCGPSLPVLRAVASSPILRF